VRDVALTRRPPPAWLLAGAAGAVAAVSLPADDVGRVVTRLLPVLGFLAAATLLAGVVDAAGVFDTAAVRCARLARGRTPVLFGLVVVLACATTVVLSLDTTAVLLTPVVLSLTRQLGLPPWPFALATAWLANTASLLLPVSNLTNLLAEQRVGLSRGAFVQAMAAPAAVAVVVTVGVLAALHGRSLRGRYPLPAVAQPPDRLLHRAAVVAVLAFLGGVVAGLPVVLAAGGAAVGLAAVAAARRPDVLRVGLVPWRLIPLVTGLLLVVETAGRHGLDDVLSRGVGHASPLGVAAVGALAANLADNLPAYLALERVVPVHRLPALLVGVDAGPVVLPWASLATLLWADRCRAAGLVVPWRRYVLSGLVLAPLVVVGSALVL
jgi:arsenical pump membrane protein